MFKDIQILYEDNHLLVVNKPVNMLMQGDATGDNDLLSIMKNYIKVTYNKPNEAYLGLVHRLDRVTGGVCVFAKTSKAASRLSNQIRLQEWKKTYFVITDNVPHIKEQKLVDYLYKDRKSNTSYVVSSQNKEAKKSLLKYKLLNTHKNHALINVDLITGRSHQIRVQFANAGMPLFGDHRYNKQVVRNTQIKLFAYELTLIHPTLKEEMTFQAPMPRHGLWREF
ncbi:MAG: RluA family pseudouridine synthase [Erysipelothrix sp.]|nr:RluA family pseudouridine synthase [Erysipelothrix sp.]